MTAPAPLTAEQERYLRDIRATVERLAAAGTSVGDLKIVAGALREMAAAFRVFGGYRHVRKVSVFGSARTTPGDRVFELARDFARRIADAGFMVITGAGPGIMEACQRGAGRERSFGVNIRLPAEQAPNAVIEGDPKLLTFRYFFTRKLFFLKEAHAVVLFPGGFGTHDEGFETLTLLQTGKTHPMPLVLLDEPGGTYWRAWQRYVEDEILRRGMISPEDLSLYAVVDDPADAVAEILRFYRVFHSARFVGSQLVLRLMRPLPAAAVRRLTDEFRDILKEGVIRQRPAFPAERTDPEILHLPRLVFRFDRLHYGRLRQLIDRINDSAA